MNSWRQVFLDSSVGWTVKRIVLRIKGVMSLTGCLEIWIEIHLIHSSVSDNVWSTCTRTESLLETGMSSCSVKVIKCRVDANAAPLISIYAVSLQPVQLHHLLISPFSQLVILRKLLSSHLLINMMKLSSTGAVMLCPLESAVCTLKEWWAVMLSGLLLITSGLLWNND